MYWFLLNRKENKMFLLFWYLFCLEMIEIFYDVNMFIKNESWILWIINILVVLILEVFNIFIYLKLLIFIIGICLNLIYIK